MKLREIRESKGLSQTALAELAHVHRVSICLYESGKKHPTVESLKRLARALGVTTDELISDERKAG